MKSRLLSSIVFIVVLFLGGCGCSNPNGISKSGSNNKIAQDVTENPKNLNVSILLDLSDRISPTRNPNNAMQYWKRDVEYIQSITYAFEQHLKNKKIILMNDHIQLYFNPIPTDIPDINNIAAKLNMTFTKDNVTKEKVDSVSSEYLKYTRLIYKKTLEEKEPGAKKGIDDYPGSDLFGFFKSNVKNYCIMKGHRNILFILTDGYIYFKNRNKNKGSDNKSNFLLSKNLIKWGFTNINYQKKLEEEGYGFQVPTKGLNDLEVYVIGIEPKQDWELDVIDNYWTNWLKRMGVKNFQGDHSEEYLKQAELPADLNRSIQGFINK